MTSTLAIRTAVAAVVLLGGMSMASAQNYPSRTVRIITTEPGASADLAARLIAHGLSIRFGQQVIVDNRGGMLAIEALVRAPSDGYTILFYGSGLWLSPIMQHTNYDPLKDVVPITTATSSPAVLTVHPSLPVKSVKELIALAKSRPGALNYGSGGLGSTPHLGAEIFNSMAGVNIVRIGFKGTGPAVNSAVGGEVQVLFATNGTVGPFVKIGKLRALAVTSLRPSAVVPGLPAVAADLPGYEVVQLQGTFAPAKTPVALVERLQQEITAVLNQPDVKERLLTSGSEAIGGPSEALAQSMRSEMARVGKIMKDAGIKPE